MHLYLPQFFIMAESGESSCPSLSIQAKRARHNKWKETKNTMQSKVTFNYCNEEDKVELFAKIKQIKTHMGEENPNMITTFELLNRVLDYYILCTCADDRDAENHKKMDYVQDVEYQLCSEEEAVNEKLFVCAMSSVKNLVARVGKHSQKCPALLGTRSNTYLQHGMNVKFSCKHDHTINWTSSPYVKGGKLLVNMRFFHGVVTSGILPGQATKLATEVKIGEMGVKYIDTLLEGNRDMSIVGYKDIVKRLADESTTDALEEEIASNISHDENETVLHQKLSILTDTQHCWRKNAKFSDIVAMGANTHKILKIVTVSKEEEISSQKHELLGIKKMYEYFDQKECHIEKHSHDNNASVTKFVNEERNFTVNLRDTWHATKGLTPRIKKITSGPASLEGIKWFAELSDKAASIKTHIYWAMKHCGCDSEKLKRNIVNI